MSRFIQTLESRQMFSTAPVVPHVSVEAATVQHVTVAVAKTMYFQGTTLNSDGSLAADLLITVKAHGKGYVATTLVCNPHGKITTVQLEINPSGQFAYSDTQNGDTTTITGQLSADRQSITGTYAFSTSNGSGTGTITCSRTSTAPTVSNYTGIMKSGDKHAALKATLVKTSTGYIGILTQPPVDPSSNGGNNGLFITIGSVGAFTAAGTQDDNPTLTIDGQLSKNAATLTGTFAGLVVDGTTLAGTFSLKRT